MTVTATELPAGSALATPVVIAISSTRFNAASNVPGRAVAVLLQLSHRLGTVALLAALATGYLAFSGRDFYAALATASGCAVVGFSCGVLTLSFVGRGRPQWREAVGVGIFNAVIAILGLALMLVARAGVIQDSVRQGGASLRSGVQEFFTAPPAIPPQP